MTTFLEEPEFGQAISITDDARPAIEKCERDWNEYCVETDELLHRAIQWSAVWKAAALCADKLKRENKIDLWSVGDTVWPKMLLMQRAFALISERLAIASPGCPLENYSSYLDANREMAKTIEYFSKWPRTNPQMEEKILADYSAGNRRSLSEFANAMRH